jgi:Fusaric acid resistance protein-like
MEFLHYSIAKALIDLVVYADSLATSGKLTKWRLILPKWKRIKRFFTNVYSTNDLSQETGTISDFQDGSHKIFLGESYYEKKDPEHLPPRNWFEAAGDRALMIPKWLASPASAFGLRAAIATISLAIPLFVRQTQAFASQNRLYWAIIMTAISMSPTSGQSIFGFILRVVGTILAMLLSWIIYYVAGNGKTPGILVLYWFFVSILLYIPIKRPQFAAVGMITVVTITLTIGYELEARKIGIIAVSTSGAKYIGILTFGPVRLATVLAGLFAAFFWTVFPYPISDHSVLRRDVGGSLYLLANYYSVVHATLSARIRRNEGSLADKTSIASRLKKIRLRLYNKLVLLLNDMRTYARFVKFEPPIGGKFPSKQYDDVRSRIER